MPQPAGLELAQQRPHQPADVEPSGTQHRVQPVPFAALEPAALHPVVLRGVADQRLDGFAPLEAALVLSAQRLVLAPVDQLDGRDVFVHAAIARVDHRDLGRHADVLQQRAGLLQLGAQRVPVKRVAGEGSGPHHQPALVRDRQADLDAELVGLPGLALADALDFRRVQCVQLALVAGALGVNAFGAAARPRAAPVRPAPTSSSCVASRAAAPRGWCAGDAAPGAAA